MVVIPSVAFVIGVEGVFVVSVVVAVVIVVYVFTFGDAPISKVVVKLHKRNCRNKIS